MSDKDVEVLKRDMQRVLNYLHNDNGTGSKGLVAEVAELKKTVNDFLISSKVERAYKKGQLVVLVFIGSGCGLLIEFLLKLALK